MQSHPKEVLPVIGDQLPDGSIFCQGDINEDMKPPAFTSSYITLIATFKELQPDLMLILQLVSSKMASESSSMLKKNNSIQFTHLRLRDCSNDVITGRLSMHVAHEGIN